MDNAEPVSSAVVEDAAPQCKVSSLKPYKPCLHGVHKCQANINNHELKLVSILTFFTQTK